MWPHEQTRPTDMSIQTLAQDLGLSISTVSRALNGYSDVAPSTRERVVQRAAELGYRPHPGARSMKSSKSNAVGVILPMDERGGPFINALYSSLLGAIAGELDTRGYTLLVTTHFSASVHDEVSRYEHLIHSRSVDGFVIVRTLLNDPRVQLLHDREVPFVTYGRSQLDFEHPWVDTDNERAFELATQRQLNHGHRLIGLLNGPNQYTFAKLRRDGYEQALRKAGLEPNPHWILEGDLTESSGYALTKQLLAQTSRPTALICANDAMAIGAIAACRQHGLRVGKDIAIMGYGNSDASRYCDPPLSTIEHKVFDNGRHLGQLLLAQLDQQHGPISSYLEPVDLIARQSDGPLVF
jgi:LacI family transcriptional regulator